MFMAESIVNNLFNQSLNNYLFSSPLAFKP